MGGAIALMSAANNKKIAYLIDYYGRIYYQQLSPNKPKHPIDWAKNLSCPTLGLFSGIDPLIPEEHVHELQSLLNRANIANEFKIYPHAKHAFFNDRRENYDQPAAQDAWKLTMDFISNSIRSFK
jgi:carboxymethylenebutenolidase